jgi:hypothetical protein
MLKSVRLHAAIAAAAFASVLALPGLAQAKAGDKTYQQTYPHASTLCADVSAGGGPKRLRTVTAQVLADCSTLQSGFGAAQSAVLTAQSSFAGGLRADRAAVAAACTPPVTDRALCRRTRRDERRAMNALRHEHRAAVRLYYRTVEANRRAFWTAVHLLPGGAGIPADAPIPQQSS